MSLKFQGVDWDKRDLMYVEFTTDGQKMRWYPKWKEVDDILHCAWLTEQGYHDSHWRDYFDIMCSEVLIRGLLRRIVPSGPSSPLSNLDVLASKLFQDLRMKSLHEGEDAKTANEGAVTVT